MHVENDRGQIIMDADNELLDPSKTDPLTFMFHDIEVPDDDVNDIARILTVQEEYEKYLATRPNEIVLYQAWRNATELDRDKNSREYIAWTNFLKLLLWCFRRYPFWNSRLGWFMWFLVCYARYDSYYPMKWCFHYDPLNFYMHDEPLRPECLERVMPDDPYNIKGKCFVHPEWYKEDNKNAE